MKILITGGAGFIGSHLAEALINKGNEIIIVDDLIRGKIKNFNDIEDRIKFLNGSITDFELMKKIISKVDIVFHLAAVSRVMPSIENPELCFKTNVQGTEIISRLCSIYNKKLIFASSREVYGTAEYISVDEKHPLQAENPYGASKICGEKIIEAYSKCSGLKYAILRLANVYGARDFERVVPIFIEKTLKNNELIVYGGEQILDFVYIKDVVEAFIKTIEGNGNIVVNIGSGNGTKVIDLAEIIKKITRSKSKVILKEKRKGEVERFIANIEKAEKILNWKPRTALEEGIRLLI
jgi:UDP-glucose 4-epimerase